MKKRYTRAKLLQICEKALVPQKLWWNRDSASTQRQVGECFALLKAGCRFKIVYENLTCTDENTIWVCIYYRGFSVFEGDSRMSSDTFFLPTEERLNRSQGKDWY